MAGQTNAMVDALQLERVLPRMRTLFDREHRFCDSVQRKPAEKVSKRDMRVPLEIRDGGKPGHFDPSFGDMGRGGGITYEKALVAVTYHKHGVEWSSESEWATEDNKQAIASNFAEALAKQLDNFKRYLDSLLMTDGTGTIGTISAISVGGGVGGGDRITLGTDGFGARLTRFGYNLNVYSSTLATNRTLGAEREVVYHDGPGKQIDLSAPSVAGMVVGDKLVVSGLSATPPSSLLGVPYHHSNASTGTWLGLPRSTNPEIRANRVAAGGPFALPFARLAVNKIGDRVGVYGKKLVVWGHPCQADAYEQLGTLVTQLAKMPNEEKLNMYFNPDNMQMAGVPLKLSYSWDKTRLDFVTDSWARSEIKALDYYKDKNGRKIFELRSPTSGAPIAGWIFYFVYGCQYYVQNPAECSYIDTLSVPSGY